ncbi:MAG: BspA family leucine-rich repeat surface protein [Prevotella sp.]|nr:BspA family leucine-rich repeat surface protein [Prevotella sp.]
MKRWFGDMTNLTSIEGLQYLNTSKVESMAGLFGGCDKLTYLDLSTFDTSNVTSMSNMFHTCLSLKGVNLSSFNTSKVENMEGMFRNCSSLRSLDLKNFDTHNVKCYNAMFLFCNLLTVLDLTSFDTHSAEMMDMMFAGCLSLRKIYVGSNWNTENVGSSEKMFAGCESLIGGSGTQYNKDNVDISYAHIDGGTSNPGYLSEGTSLSAYAQYYNGTLTFYYDKQKASRVGNKYPLNSDAQIPGWYNDGNYKNVTQVVFDPSFIEARPQSTYFWFNSMTKLTSITGLEYLKTSGARTMRAMFYDCSSLTSLDLSKFDTSTASDLGYMFWNCNKLASLDISSFNTNSVTDMGYMFTYCQSLKELDLTNFNTENVVTMVRMFTTCTKLEKISAGDGWSMAKVENSLEMFDNCLSLVGGEGTTYNSSHTDGAYAHIDGGTSNPGYLTYGVPTAYDLWIGGVRVTSVTKDRIPVSGGWAEFQPEWNHLILHNCTIAGNGTSDDGATGYGAGIYSNIPDLHVYIDGNVTVSGTSSDARTNGIFFDGKTTIYGSSHTASLTATGYCGIFSDTLTMNTEGVCTSFTVTCDGTYAGLVGKRDHKSRPTLIYIYNRPLIMRSEYLIVRCRGGELSSMAYWESLAGHPRLEITSPDPSVLRTHWNEDKHMITDFDGLTNGNPLVGEWTVFEVPVDDYGLSIYDTPVTSRNREDILGDGAFSYSPDSKTLVISETYNGKGTGAIVQNNSVDGLVVNIPRDVYIGVSNGFYSKKDMTIQGPGKLMIDSDMTIADITDGATLTIKDITIEAESKQWGIVGERHGEKLVVENASVKTTAPQGAVCDFTGGITLTGCNIITPTGGKIAGGAVVNANGSLATEVWISNTMTYDLNGDGKVSTADIQIIINEMKKAQASQNMQYDLNGDGKISTADIQVIINEMKK